LVAVAADPTREAGNLVALVEDIPVVPFHVAAAIAYELIHGATRGSRKDHLDKLIAAHAVFLDVILVTNHEADFAKYPGLRTESWVANLASN
jgi:tRNA(fMet)-specific endonuclease VapC